MHNNLSHSQIGKKHEEKAAAFLRENGCEILAKNYRCKFGEIDLIIKDEETLAFVEVKYKASGNAGYAEEAVTPAKIHKICRGSDFYRFQEGVTEDRLIRFDVVAINEEDVKWYRNAFDYQ